jgi:PAS domain S-box-containing protein
MSGAFPPAQHEAGSGDAADVALSRRERQRLYPRTGTRLPVILVLICLALALLVPHLAQRRINRLRDEINLVADPARGDVAAIALDLALESAARRGYALTGDAQLARDITGSLQRRRSAEQRLQSAALRLDSAVPAALAVLAQRLAIFDADMDSLEARGIVRREPTVALHSRQPLFNDVMTATQRLDSAILRAADARRAAIAATENTVGVVSAVLVMLGLGAALLVARLGNRFRAVALRLDESDSRFRQIADNLSSVVWLSDPNFQRLLYVNLAYERLWGRSPAQLYVDADSFIEGVHPSDREAVHDALARMSDGSSDVEFRIIRPDGTVRWVMGRGFPVRDESGRVFRMAGIIEDITEQHQYLTERERLLDNERRARVAAEERRLALEEVTESRARLIRGFTHDVKNPLGAADGFLALLQQGVNGVLSRPQLDWIARARKSIGHALELIRQLLELARAEAGELAIRSSATDVAELVREVTEAFRAQAAAKSLSVNIDVASHLPVVQTDATRVRQIVGNLVSNAVKYTRPGGHIAVCAKLDGRDEGETQLAIEVSDDGPGIPDDQLARIFSEFTRLDPTAAEGAGIGLAISQRIATALGGVITVNSSIGRGTTFALRLPVGG